MERNHYPLNIILFVSDTFRRDHIRCYGNTWIRTPNLNRFAEMCVIFDHAYCGSYPTVPARTDLMTGKWTFPHRDWSPLPRDEIVLSQILGQSGYTTMMIVDTPHIVRDGYYFDRGFQGFVWVRGQENERYQTDPIDLKELLPCDPSKCRNPDTSVIQYLRNTFDRRYEEDYFAARTVTEALRWLERNYRRERFFLYLDLFDPHEPWDPPRYYTELYDPGYEGEEVIYPRYWYWQEFLTEAELKHCHALYCGEVTMVDYWFGRLLSRLESLGLLDKTVIIFTSDHGFYFGEHGIIGKALFRVQDGRPVLHRSPIYDEVARIPLLVYVPGVKPGRCDAFTGFVDLMPTILDLAGAEVPEFVQGKSLVPFLRGERPEWRDFFVTSWAIIHEPKETITQAVDGTERIVLSPRPSTIHTKEWTLIYSVEGDVVELYHTASDPRQERNVVKEYPQVAREIHAKFVRFLEECGTKEDYLEHRRKITV